MRCIMLLLAMLLLAGCGEDEITSCEELLNVQKMLCEGAEECFPCVCPLCNMGLEIVWDALGRPDILRSSCIEIEQGKCVGVYREWAEGCLANAPSGPDENPPTQGWLDEDCDPRYSLGFWLCGNDGSAAFPEVLEKGRTYSDCGR